MSGPAKPDHAKGVVCSNCATLYAQVDALRKVLEPFSAFYDAIEAQNVERKIYGDAFYTIHSNVGERTISIQDFQKAREALKESR